MTPIEYEVADFIKRDRPDAVKTILSINAMPKKANDLAADRAKLSELYYNIESIYPKLNEDLMKKYFILIEKINLYEQTIDHGYDIDYPTWSAKFDIFIKERGLFEPEYLDESKQ